MNPGSDMKVGFDQGRPIIAASEIAALLELDVPVFQDLMLSGSIRSTVERGEGEDDGKFLLTFQSPQWRLRLTCKDDGEVLTLTRVRLTTPPAVE